MNDKMTHISWGINFCELAKIRYYGGINFAEVEKKNSTKWLYDREKKKKMSKKIASTFPNEGNQNTSRSKGDFQILKVIEETTKLSAPESFWYFRHNYSQDKLLQTTLSVFNFACINFCDW